MEKADPHESSRESPSQLEEERRLLFVGITRARQELQLSQARLRGFRGVEKMTVPSPFLIGTAAVRDGDRGRHMDAFATLGRLGNGPCAR